MEKLIKNSRGYYITSDGVVKRKGKILKQSYEKSGYFRISITYEDGSKKKDFVHRLVAKTFLDNPNNYPVVNHLDGDKTNNKVSNLEWTTYKGNAEHASKAGLLQKGANHYNSQYDEDFVHMICKRLEEGCRNCDLEKEFGLPKHFLRHLRNGTGWLHISKLYDIQKIRQKRISANTVKWVCQKLEDGMSFNDILSLANGTNISYSFLYDLYHRRTYKHISQNFKF